MRQNRTQSSRLRVRSHGEGHNLAEVVPVTRRLSIAKKRLWGRQGVYLGVADWTVCFENQGRQ